MLQRVNDVTYKIQRTARAKPVIVHRNRLKRYAGDTQLGWWESAARGASAEEGPAREEGQGARRPAPQSGPQGSSPPVCERTRREPVDGAELGHPGRSGGVSGGENSDTSGREGSTPAEPSPCEPEAGGAHVTSKGRRVRRPARYCSTLTPESPSDSLPRTDRLACPHCQRGFNQRTNLRRHLRTACPELFTVRPYACERGCGLCFYRSDMRDRHHRYCDHVLVDQAGTGDPDVREVFTGDVGLGGDKFPTEQSPPPACPPEGAAWTRPRSAAAGEPSPPVPSRSRGRGSRGRPDRRDQSDSPSGTALVPWTPAAAATAGPSPLRCSEGTGARTEVEPSASVGGGGRRNCPPAPG